MTDGLRITVTETPRSDEIDRVRAPLIAENRQAVDPAWRHCERPLAVFLRDGEDQVVGGLLGVSFWSWVFVEALWIAPPLRRRGEGRRLVAAAEAEARRRGCHAMLLDTFSFQAPGFYRAMGFVELAALEDFPPPHQRFFFAKRLA